jgi:phosphate/phosphite/phosphonate ABC transporter binding protein
MFLSFSLAVPLRRLVAVALVFASLVPLPVLAGDPGVLVLGRISDDPKAHYEQLKALLDYVVPRMKDVGIREGRILMAKDAQQMASYLRRGRVDWVTETAGTGMMLKQRAGARPILLTERDGTSHYHSVFFARADSSIRSLDDLRGHSVAFQRPLSTSAYFLPATELLHRGDTLELLLSPTDKLDSNVVGYVFARSELNIATWVHKRLVDVGVMSNQDWENPRRVPAAFRRDLRVIGETGDVPRAVELVRSDLDPKVEARLRKVLCDASRDPEAKDALLGFFRTTRFLSVDATSQRALDDLADGVGRVRNEVE